MEADVMRRRLRRIPLTPLGWTVLVLVVGFGAAALIAGSGTIAVVAAVGLALVVLMAVGAPRNVRDLNIPPTVGPPFIPPRDDEQDD